MSEPETIIFTVDESSDLPIWAQLRNRIAYLIHTGYFAPDEQLPSVRTQAIDSRINYNTVSKAYRDLELSGLIYSLRGRGMFVRANQSGEDDTIRETDALLASCFEQYRFSGMSVNDIREHLKVQLRRFEEMSEEN